MPKTIGAGDFIHRLEIQDVDDSKRDAFQAAVPHWATEAKRWAKIEPGAGAEPITANQAMPNHSHKITLRYYAPMTAKKRLKEGARCFNVVAFNHDEDTQLYTICYCNEDKTVALEE
jgi:SPP1 family predicted phage head-tail adaptor